MTLNVGVLSQRTYPGAGDVDDCWVVATVWAYRASTGATKLPTVPQFRAAAGRPDLPGPTGGRLSHIMGAVHELWPGLAVTKYETTDWTGFHDALRGGAFASLGVQSSLLPLTMQFGFKGAHQVGVYFDGRYLVANPLAKEGSAPLPISETALRTAARGLAQGWILAALFPRGEPMQRYHLTGRPIGTYVLLVDTALIAMDESRVAVKAGRTGSVFARATLPDGRPCLLVGYDDTTGLLVADERCRFTEAPDPTDAAYNAGRDAVVNAATAVPRR